MEVHEQAKDNGRQGAHSVIDHTLQGPFLTRAEAARRVGASAPAISRRPDLLRLGGKWLPEVYFAFQFNDDGVCPGIGAVVQELRGHHSDRAIAEWLSTAHRDLGFTTPLDYLCTGGSAGRVIDVAASDGPATAMTPQPRSIPESA